MIALLRVGIGATAGLGALVAASGWTQPATKRQARRPFDYRWVLHGTVGLFVGGLVFAASGWPIAGLAACAATIAVARGRGSQRSDRDRVEALAGWAEQLRDTLSAGHGITETIEATARIAPEPIRAEVAQLALRLRRETPRAALQSFADVLDDPTADLIVAILALAIERSGRAASELLSELAVTARERVEMRLRVDAERASTRAEARWVAGSSAFMMIALMVFGHHWLKPYSTATGQVVLAVVFGLYAAGAIGLARLARYRDVERFLRTERA